jgi:hypothetical protein
MGMAFTLRGKSLCCVHGDRVRKLLHICLDSVYTETVYRYHTAQRTHTRECTAF